MDHKVSKDMISSGMTPSGEKTQADLGRTQYGSAPSPSRLMDAYKSMYKEENLDEMTGGTPAGGTPKITRLKPNLKAQADAVHDSQFSDDFDRTAASGVKDSPEAKKIKQDKIKKGRESFRTGQKQENVDLLSSYRAVYEHHKKDADGNTIPHEGEEVNEVVGMMVAQSMKKGAAPKKKTTTPQLSAEGKIPSGLQAYLDKKKGKKEVKEGADLFDVIATHFIDEGYEEKEVYKVMANLTEDQLQNLHEVLPAIGAIGAALKAGKIGAVASKIGAVGAKVGAAASKAGAFASKGLASAGKAIPTSVKNVGKTIAKNVTTDPTQIGPQPFRNALMGKNTGGVGQSLKSATKQNIQNIPKRVAAPFKAVAKAPGQIKNFATKAKDTFNNMSTFEKLQTAQTAQGLTSSIKPKGIEKKSSSRNISASADLFDIVKGKLLDEGLSVEEIKDIMLTLTPNEIMKEIEESSMSDGSAGGAYQDLGPQGGFRSKEQINRMHNDPKGTEKYGKKLMKRVGQAVRDTGTPTVRKVDESKK